MCLNLGGGKWQRTKFFSKNFLEGRGNDREYYGNWIFGWNLLKIVFIILNVNNRRYIKQLINLSKTN